MFKRIALAAFAAALSSVAVAADLPPFKARATVTPAVVGYSNTTGLYWGVGTYAQIDQAKVTSGAIGSSDLFAVGAALELTLGYIRPIAGGGGFLAFEGSCGLQNVGGTTQVVGITTNEVRSRISCGERIKFGGPITNLLNILPQGLPLPTLPNIGAPSGSSHPYLFVGARQQREFAEDVLMGVQRERWTIKGELGGGFIQQFDSGIAADVYVSWRPEQGGFNIGGPASVNMGDGYRMGVKLLY